MNTHQTIKIVAFITVVGITGVIFSACQYSNPAPKTQASPTANNAEATPVVGNAVTIQNFAFSPANLQVKVGQTVTWTNQDQMNHTITSDTGAFDSGNVANGGTYSFTFTKAGTYPYHCNIHTSMKAQITVVE